MLAALKTWLIGRVGKRIGYKEKGEGSIPLSIIFFALFRADEARRDFSNFFVRRVQEGLG